MELELKYFRLNDLLKKILRFRFISFSKIVLVFVNLKSEYSLEFFIDVLVELFTKPLPLVIIKVNNCISMQFNSIFELLPLRKPKVYT